MNYDFRIVSCLILNWKKMFFLSLKILTPLYIKSLNLNIYNFLTLLSKKFVKFFIFFIKNA